MFSYTRFICTETDIAAVLMAASPDAEKVVTAQPPEDLAYQVLGDPYVLEIVTAPEPSLMARNASGSTSQLAAPPIFKPVIVLRQQKASYVFGSSRSSNVCLPSAGVAPEEFEMALYYITPGVHVRFFTNSSYIDNRPIQVGTRHLVKATQLQIKTFMFHLVPVCSFISEPDIGSSIVSETSSTGERQPSLNDFRSGRKIGEGGQGGVYIHRCKKSQQQLAVKILEPVNAQELRRAIRETLISPKVNHEFLLKVLEVHKFAEGTALVMPLLELGSLYNYLAPRQHRCSSTSEAKTIIVQLLLGVAHLHSILIMHRDIKPANIMIHSLEPYLTIKLTDFGLAVWSRTAFSVGCTPKYGAPEIYKYQRTEKFDNKVDTFSIGMVGLELLGIKLENTVYCSQYAFDTEVGTLIESDMHSATTQEELAAFRTLQAMTAYYPSRRPKVSACFRLEWFEKSKKEWRPDSE